MHGVPVGDLVGGGLGLVLLSAPSDSIGGPSFRRNFTVTPKRWPQLRDVVTPPLYSADFLSSTIALAWQYKLQKLPVSDFYRQIERHPTDRCRHISKKIFHMHDNDLGALSDRCR